MYDYIVIGSGSSGAAVAGRLVQAGSKVLLLEAGGKDDSETIRIPGVVAELMDSPYDWGYRTVPQSQLLGRRIFLVRGKGLGGSSLLNYMVYMRGAREDFEQWKSLGNENWGYKDVLPFFKKMETNTRFKDDFHGSSGPLIVTDIERSPLTAMFLDACAETGLRRTEDFNGATQEGYGYLQATIGPKGRCSAADAYLHPVMQQKNFSVMTHAHATKILVEKGRAVGVEYIHFGKQEKALAANEVILCAGALNTPQLLMISGIGSGSELKEKDIDVVLDLPGVGKNLQDHAYVLTRAEIKEPMTVFGMSEAEYLASRKEYMAKRSGKLATNWCEAGAFVRSSPGVDRPDLQWHFEPTFGVDSFEGLPLDRHGVNMLSDVCRPLSRGTLTINSKDPFDRPLIDPKYLSHQTDLDLALAGVRKCMEIMQTKAFSKIGTRLVYPAADMKSDEDLTTYVRKNLSTVFHVCGTCKMGSDSMSVVDQKLKVNGITGLRVADASIMPEIISGNIHATCVMIGERAADFILNHP